MNLAVLPSITVAELEPDRLPILLSVKYTFVSVVACACEAPIAATKTAIAAILLRIWLVEQLFVIVILHIWVEARTLSGPGQRAGAVYRIAGEAG